MLNNTDLLQELFAQNRIALENAAFLETAPVSMPDIWDFDRIEGMLLGLAIGDSLGNTTESQLPFERMQAYGEIKNYLPNMYANGQSVGLPSDDTQMAFWTLEQLLEDHGLVPEHLALKFTQKHIFGIGSTVKEFLRTYKDQGRSWKEAGQASAGNGALMRIAPILIPHLPCPTPALWADTILAGMITHNDRASNACCVTFINMLWQCLLFEKAPDPVWWIDTFVSVAHQLEGAPNYKTRNTAFSYS